MQTDEADLIVGAFYWVQPALDPDRAQEWEYFAQPARFYGRDEHGRLLWQCINQDDWTDWTMRWIGPRIVSPLGDEDDRLAKENAGPDDHP